MDDAEARDLAATLDTIASRLEREAWAIRYVSANLTGNLMARTTAKIRLDAKEPPPKGRLHRNY